LPAFAPDAAFRAKLANLSLVSQRPHGHLHTGGRRSRATGSSLEFADHRSYSPGDDYRQIDWNIYARTDELFVKVRESEETLVVHLLLDVSGSMASGAPAKFETARAVQAAIGWTALASRDVVAGAALGAGLMDHHHQFEAAPVLVLALLIGSVGLAQRANRKMRRTREENLERRRAAIAETEIKAAASPVDPATG